MDYIKGDSREQVILFPQSVDEYVEKDNPVVFVDVFVDSLDLADLGFKYSKIKSTGRPPYDPGDLLKLYIYGYLNKIRSSRGLEREIKRNVELMWLLKKLVPDHKTISNFRSDNAGVIKTTFKKFSLICRNLNLFGAQLVAIDGSKFKAQNSKKKNFTETKLKRYIRDIEKKIDDYMDELDENDTAEADMEEVSAQELKDKIETLKKRAEDYKELKTEMDESGKTEVSLTDPDAKMMMNNQKVEVCYNMQIAVDSKHKLIVDHDLTNNPADQTQLVNMVKKAKQELGTDKLKVLADKGYYDSRQIKESQDIGAEVFIPKPKRSLAQGPGFNKDKFKYEQKTDTYTCPGGHTLVFNKLANDRGKTMRLYKGNDCCICPAKNRCTKAKYRTISRWEHEDYLEDMQTRVINNHGLIRQRQWLVEHPFGTLKRSFDQGYFLLRGLEKVKAEASLSALAYNIKRAINIVGTKELIAAISPG